MITLTSLWRGVMDAWTERPHYQIYGKRGGHPWQPVGTSFSDAGMAVDNAENIWEAGRFEEMRIEAQGCLRRCPYAFYPGPNGYSIVWSRYGRLKHPLGFCELRKV